MVDKSFFPDDTSQQFSSSSHPASIENDKVGVHLDQVCNCALHMAHMVWCQCYASIQPSFSIPMPGMNLHSPVLSSLTLLTPVPTLHHSICKSDLSKPLLLSHSNSVILSQPLKDIRDVHKHKYVTGLVGKWAAPFLRSLAHVPILATLIFIDAFPSQMLQSQDNLPGQGDALLVADRKIVQHYIIMMFILLTPF